MAKGSKLTTNFLSTILVLIVTTLFLSYVNIKNHQDGVDIDAEEIQNSPALFNPQFENQVFVFQNEQEFKGVFPASKEKIDFKKYIVGAYISTSQPNPGYDIHVAETSRQNDVIEVTYKLAAPDSNKIYSDVISYPVVLVKISRTGLAAITTHTIKFTSKDTKDSVLTKFDLHEN